MGGRDHTEQCPKCGIWCGGLDDAPCNCTVIEDTFAAADRTKAAFEKREAGIAKMRETLARLRAVLNPERRTYHWTHPTIAHDIRCPQWGDREMAGRVRMVSRSDLDHEMIVTAARDRIVHLAEIVEAARALLNDEAAACSEPAQPAPSG